MHHSFPTRRSSDRVTEQKPAGMPNTEVARVLEGKKLVFTGKINGYSREQLQEQCRLLGKSPCVCCSEPFWRASPCSSHSFLSIHDQKGGRSEEHTSALQ